MEFRLAADFFDHPKIMGLAATLGGDTPVYLIRLYAYAASQPSIARTGDLGTVTPEWVEQRCGWRQQPHGQLFKTLTNLGLLVVNDDGHVTIYNWAKHQGVSQAKKRSEKARKAAEARWSKKKPEPVKRPVKRPVAKPKPKRERAPDGMPEFYAWVQGEWNRVAGARGFAKLRAFPAQRKRGVNATVKEFGDDRALWAKAILCYAQDADRWPERVRYGFDTFIRPGQRAKWFEGVPKPEANEMEGWTFDE